jgi:hypothetical protein
MCHGHNIGRKESTMQLVIRDVSVDHDDSPLTHERIILLVDYRANRWRRLTDKQQPIIRSQIGARKRRQQQVDPLSVVQAADERQVAPIWRQFQRPARVNAVYDRERLDRFGNQSERIGA